MFKRLKRLWKLGDPDDLREIIDCVNKNTTDLLKTKRLSELLERKMEILQLISPLGEYILVKEKDNLDCSTNYPKVDINSIKEQGYHLVGFVTDEWKEIHQVWVKK